MQYIFLFSFSFGDILFVRLQMQKKNQFVFYVGVLWDMFIDTMTGNFNTF